MKVRLLSPGAVIGLLAACVIAVIAAMPAALIVSSLYEDYKNSRYDDDLVWRLRTVPRPSSQIHRLDVTAPTVDVFPDGMAADHASRYLSANGFSCAATAETSGDRAEWVCSRVIKRLVCGEEWTVRLGLSRDRTIVDRKANLRSICV